MSLNAVLLSSGRQGTLLVLTALASRVDVRVYDQLIGDPQYLEGATGKQLTDYLFDRPTHDALVTILPVAWFNARDCYPGFWEELRERRVPAVHLHRRNLLRSYVSIQLAWSSGQWITTEESKTDHTVTIDPPSCRSFVETELRSEQRLAEFFAGQPQFDLYYEDLIRDYDRQLERLQVFLGLVPQRIRPTCHKQARKPLSKLIRNYDEFREAWKGTAWADWLSDELEPAVEPAGPDQRPGRLLETPD
jgi:hypothetical protein